jgi:glycosyltransferase involved in cell wall biosynthesis
MTAAVALAHDYLTQRGGAERVLLSMLRAFPGAPIQTSVYEPAMTFPEFRNAEVHTSLLNAFGPLRRHHRALLPVLAGAFASMTVDSEVALCSSSGWAHGCRAEGAKIVYCYTPARWLYQTDRYLGESVSGRAAGVGLKLLRSRLLRWDREAAQSAGVYLTLSSVVRDRIRAVYDRDAEIIPAPHSLNAKGPQVALPDIEPGFFLCVSRLLPYKNVDRIVEAFRDRAQRRLVVVGEGPDAARLLRNLPPNVRMAGRVSDSGLRWLYANCAALVAASYEDYGLTPLEAAAFGKPSVVVRWGGFLDTVIDQETGVFFDSPEPAAINRALDAGDWNELDLTAILAQASRFDEQHFVARLRQVVDHVRR